jgi:hypothetical protein
VWTANKIIEEIFARKLVSYRPSPLRSPVRAGQVALPSVTSPGHAKATLIILSRNKIARQVTRIIAQCNSAFIESRHIEKRKT